ncbi:uncharacterized protein LOC122290064 [Carya illinoinensis]|uniref:uncharacterized protein LOC122290064 n=1 Tax=Carya illinoinensis TaxID=32201 RepID=UPI001C722056|nr:uncharacterized protein LOC122290064 [Carya illinoinensis]
MEGCLIVDPVGRRGGLVLMWKYQKEVEVINYSNWHVNVLVKGEKEGSDWHFTGFYGHPETGKRRLSWELLREALEECGLVDIGCKGNGFAWSNKQEDLSFTKERLDRFVINNSCRTLFKELKVENLIGRCSDHLPILLTGGDGDYNRRRSRVPFRFEACWIKQEGCEQAVKQGWEKWIVDSEPIQKVKTKLSVCSGILSSCFKESDKGRTKEIETISKRIKELQGELSQEGMTELKHLQERVGTLLEQEDIK